MCAASTLSNQRELRFEQVFQPRLEPIFEPRFEQRFEPCKSETNAPTHTNTRTRTHTHVHAHARAHTHTRARPQAHAHMHTHARTHARARTNELSCQSDTARPATMDPAQVPFGLGQWFLLHCFGPSGLGLLVWTPLVWVSRSIV